VRRVFPGSLSNHHLGTLLGLLLTAYEMNAFKLDYQKARDLQCQGFRPCSEGPGVKVEGDPGIGYTETHQVIVRVGYGKGPGIAERLEQNNIVVNYQGRPMMKALRPQLPENGVQEMTRFGMRRRTLASWPDT